MALFTSKDACLPAVAICGRRLGAGGAMEARLGDPTLSIFVVVVRIGLLGLAGERKAGRGRWRWFKSGMWNLNEFMGII